MVAPQPKRKTAPITAQTRRVVTRSQPAVNEEPETNDNRKSPPRYDKDQEHESDLESSNNNKSHGSKDDDSQVRHLPDGVSLHGNDPDVELVNQVKDD